METEIKAAVKAIFSSNTFEEALEKTRPLRGEYIAEHSVKSWNSLVSYYKKLDIVPSQVVAEAVPEYGMPVTDAVDNDNDDENDMTPENEEPEKDIHDDDSDIKDEAPEENSMEEDTVDYMLYQNDGEKVLWYGHIVNHKNLKVGESAVMIRMNNLGIGRGKVLATARMTMDEVSLFHRCYAHIRAWKSSDKSKVELFKRAFDNLQGAVQDPAFPKKGTNKTICEFILNHKSDK